MVVLPPVGAPLMRYFFDVRAGEFIRDEWGIDLDDAEAARLHAVTLSGDLLRREEATFWHGEEWQVEVRDEDGVLCFVLSFMATDDPAVPPPRTERRSLPGPPKP